MKKALIFIDGSQIKIVFGNSLKVMSPQDMKLPHNRSFLEKLFSEHRVLYVENAGEMSIVEFVAGVEAKLTQDKAPEPQKLPPSAVAGPHQPQAQPRPQSRPPQAVEHGQWIKSNAKTIIIIDDLLTNEELAPGIKNSLSIPPGRAISLNSLDPAKVAASNTLRRLLQNGTLVMTDPGEALRLEAEHEERVREDNDARLDQYSPIIDGSARDYAERGLASGNNRGAQMVELGGDEGPSSPNPEDSGSMSGLMDMMKESAGILPPGQDDVPAAPRTILQRPGRDGIKADPTAMARKIGRKHGAE